VGLCEVARTFRTGDHPPIEPACSFITRRRDEVPRKRAPSGPPPSSGAQ
jgi:hypothetical protein